MRTGLITNIDLSNQTVQVSQLYQKPINKIYSVTFKDIKGSLGKTILQLEQLGLKVGNKCLFGLTDDFEKIAWLELHHPYSPEATAKEFETQIRKMRVLFDNFDLVEFMLLEYELKVHTKNIDSKRFELDVAYFNFVWACTGFIHYFKSLVLNKWQYPEEKQEQEARLTRYFANPASPDYI